MSTNLQKPETKASLMLSDKCKPVSVDRDIQEFMQHRVAATQQEQLYVEPYM